MIDTVVFDMGGVLVDFHPRKGLKDLGFSKECVDAFMSRIFSGFWEECDKRPISREEIIRLFTKELPEYEKEVKILWEGTNTRALTNSYDYSKEWLKSLQESGLKVYILSNFGQVSFENHKEIYTFLEHTDGGVISYEVSQYKPNPDIYQTLIHKYGITPEHAVFIDDRKVNVDAARSVGMQGIVFESFKDCKEKLAELL